LSIQPRNAAESADIFELADEVTPQINDVRIDVAVDAAAAGLLLQPPVHREIRVGQPVLRVAGAEMKNPPQRALANHPLRQRDGRDAPVIVADHVDDLRLLRGGQHLLAFLEIQAERFFAENVLAVFHRFNRHLRVQIRRRHDVHDINQRRLDDFAPVGRGVLPAELGACRLHRGGIAAANCVQLDVGLEVEEAGRLPPGIRVRPTHETVTDHPDTQSFCHKTRG
jgi:hypothetical protein